MVGCIRTVTSGIELLIIRCFIVSQVLMLALTTEPGVLVSELYPSAILLYAIRVNVLVC